MTQQKQPPLHCIDLLLFWQDHNSKILRTGIHMTNYFSMYTVLFSDGQTAKKWSLSNSTFWASKMIPATQNQKKLWNPVRKTWNNSIYLPWTGLDWACGNFSKLCNKSFISINKKSFCQKKVKSMDRNKSAKMAKWLFFCQIAILALLSLFIDFKNSFGQMTSLWVLGKIYYILMLKKCLLPCPGPSMCLSKRKNLIFSSFPC